MFKIAVLASTNGTDLQAIIDEMKAGKMPEIELVGVLSNKKCYALERAKIQGYATFFIDPYFPKNKENQSSKNSSKNQNNSKSKRIKKSRQEFDQELLKTLENLQPDLIVLVGYMRILTTNFVQKYPKKIINVHPALIPKFSGKDFYGSNVHEAVLQAGEKETGMTIHYVDEGVDTGEIILQKSCPVDPRDTPDSLKEKVQALEKKWYPEVIRQLARSAN